ncbi:MAG TPA: hydantoinase/oxoprolinase family protein [Burkholderiaceae bacterium]|nr:hydantoinase/oxoprolinase family protein [Burkholderiaceae bacterium]
MPERTVVGWDIGGAHVKAALLRRGQVIDAAQWPCPLWQGIERLNAALDSACSRWPGLQRHAHAVTMTGEMVDLFAHREDGVTRLAQLLAHRLAEPRFFGGAEAWFSAADAARHWRQVASANWLATARHVALVCEADTGLLIDIGSTTTDLIAFGHGRVQASGRSDAERLQRGELVYHGVVRTPLCALAQRIDWRGVPSNVMNEFFATTADVYRLTGELDAAHDQHPSADNAPKDTAHSCARLARMIGLDARDAGAEEWIAFARQWRARQCDELRAQVARVAAAHALGPAPVAVAAGCGAFLVPDLVGAGCRVLDYGRDVAAISADAQPAVAVASLYEREQR